MPLILYSALLPGQSHKGEFWGKTQATRALQAPSPQAGSRVTAVRIVRLLAILPVAIVFFPSPRSLSSWQRETTKQSKGLLSSADTVSVYSREAWL